MLTRHMHPTRQTTRKWRELRRMFGQCMRGCTGGLREGRAEIKVQQEDLERGVEEEREERDC